MNEFESKPRWPGAPPICTATNLPAFESAKAGSKFLDGLCGHDSVIASWQCKKCWQWHLWTGSELSDRIGKLIFETRIA